LLSFQKENIIGRFNNKYYNKKTHQPCRENIHNKKQTDFCAQGIAFNRKENGCCGHGVYNKTTHDCIKNYDDDNIIQYDLQEKEIQLKEKDLNRENCNYPTNETGCFNGKKYDYKKEYVCGEHILDYGKQGICNGKIYDLKMDTCCDSKIIKGNPVACYIQTKNE